MKITYDKEANAIYFYLNPKKLKVTTTLQPDKKDLYFIDMHENIPVGIEILNVSSVFNKNNVEFLDACRVKKTLCAA